MQSTRALAHRGREQQIPIADFANETKKEKVQFPPSVYVQIHSDELDLWAGLVDERHVLLLWGCLRPEPSGRVHLCELPPSGHCGHRRLPVLWYQKISIPLILLYLYIISLNYYILYL